MEIKAIKIPSSLNMQKLYDVDECNPSHDLSMNNIGDFLESATNKNGDGPSSGSATDSTERTVSYECTDDGASTDDQNDDLASEVVRIHDNSEEQPATIIELDESNPEATEPKCLQTIKQACQSNIKEHTEPVNRQRKKLRWGMIEMRLHSVIPGDHPDTREGPPLTMDWEIVNEQKISIDGYEAKRPPRLKTLGFDMRIGSMDRLNVLRRGGVKEEEINSAMESARRTRKQRLRTSETWRRQFVGIEELHEKIMRKLAKAMNPERRTKLITRY